MRCTFRSLPVSLSIKGIGQGSTDSLIDCLLLWFISFDTWIRTIDSYIGDDFSYLNAKGIIVPSAVMKKGDSRPNAFREDGLREAEGDGICAGEDEVDEREVRSAEMEG